MVERMSLSVAEVPLTASRAVKPPEGSVFAVARSAACLALVLSDGRIAVMSRRLSQLLGLDGVSELSGLSLASLWPPVERASVEHALTDALHGRSASVPLDLSYATATREIARVTLAPGPGGCTVLLTLDPPAPA
jgi:hypothetical protein